MLTPFLKKSFAFGPRRRAARPERPSRRFRLEQLEDRVVPTLFTTNITLQGPYAGKTPVAETVNSSAGTGGGLSYTANLAKNLTTNNAPTYATGAILLASYKVKGGGQNNLKGDSLVLTYALQGAAQVPPNSGAAATGNFTLGVMGIYDIPGTLDLRNPGTWGPATVGAKLVYSASLIPAVATVQGTNPAGDNTFAGQGMTGQNQANFFVASGAHSPGAFVVQTNANAANAKNLLFSTPNAFDGFQAEIDELNALLVGGTPYSSPPFPSNANLNANFDAVAALDPSVTFGTATPFTDAGGYNPLATGATGDALQEIGITLYPVVSAPTLVTTAAPNGTVTLGTTAVTLKDSAVLSGGVNNPGGTITFTLTYNGTTVVDTEAVTVSGNGTYTTPAGFTLPTAAAATGNYVWTAAYSGDTHNNPASDPGTSAQEKVTVNPASPALVTTASPNGTVTLGTTSVTLNDSAALSGGYFPTGSIVFTLKLGATTVYTDTVTVSGNGTYTTATGSNPGGFTLPTAAAATGNYVWTASYGGNGNNNPASDPGTSAQEKVTVNPASPALVTTASPNGTVTLGTTAVTLKDSAVLSGGYFPTGTITFKLTYGSTVVDTETVTVSGNGTYTTPTGFTLPTAAAATGSYVWTASYADPLGNNNPASDPGTSAQEKVTVNPASPALVTTASPNGTVTLTPSGVKLNDSAVLSGGYFPTGSIVFTLKLGATTVYTDTVTVSGNGTYDTSTGTNPGGFTATTVGSYVWTATYADPLGNNNPASDPGTSAQEKVNITPASPALVTTAAPNGTVTLGTTSVTLKDSAVLSGGVSNPGGTITFTLTYNGSTVVDTEAVTVSGNGTYTTPTGFTLPTAAAATGSYVWTASYGGDANNKPASDPGTSAQEKVTVNPASPALVTTASPNGTVTLGTTSVTLNDSAALSGGYFPTGSIVFTLKLGTTTVYTDTVTVSGNGTYTTATGSNPGGFTLPTAAAATGSYVWTASYHDPLGNNNDASDPGTSAQEKVTVNPASPALVTTASPNGTVTLGTTAVTLKDSAVLSGGYFPTGTITFKLTYGSTVVDTETVTVSGNGTYTTPTGFTLPTAAAATGSYVWTASYADPLGNNNPASDPGTSAQEKVTVNPASPALVTTASPNGTVTLTPSGVKLNDSAVLSGGYFPTGSIVFTLKLGATTVYTDTVTVSGNGTYDTSTGTNPGGFTATTVGSYVWTATYADPLGNNNPASDPGTSAQEKVNITPASPALVTTAAPNGTVTLGTTSVTLKDSAVLSGGVSNPGGTITFTLTYNGSTVVDTEAVTVSGNGTYTTPTGFTLPTAAAATGSYVWTASYGGDANNKPASDPGTSAQEKVTVNPASPALVTTAAPNGTVVLTASGVKLNDSAVLSGGYFPTGSIVFTLKLGATTVYTDTVTVSGNGTYDTSTGTNPGGFTATTVGSYVWTATYADPLGNNNPASDPGTSAQEKVNITPASPALVTTAAPNGTVTLGTTSVTLKDSAVLSGGVSNPGGTITFTLTYNGSTVVDTEAVTVSGNGTYTTPTGFTLPTAAAATGSYVWTASYGGDANNKPASDPGTSAQEKVTVNPASPALVTTASPNGTVVLPGDGTKVTLKDSAVLSGGYFPTGTITFTLTYGSTVVDTEAVTVSGNGTYTTPTGFTLPTAAAATGSYVWTASYADPLGNNNPASDPGTSAQEKVTVNPASPALVTTASPNGTVTLGTTSVTLNDSAALSGGYFPTGSIVFTLKLGTTTVYTDTVTVSGNGTYTTATGSNPGGFTLPTAAAATGSYVWTASYHDPLGNNNDASDPGTSAQEKVTVNPASPALVTTASPNGTVVLPGDGTKVTLKDSAVLSGGYFPTGTITFTLTYGSTVVDTETVTVSGNGTYTTPTGFTLPTAAAATGSYVWTASYADPLGNNNPASDPGTSAQEKVTVNPASPALVTTASPNGTVTLTPSGVKLNDSAVLSGGYFPTGSIVFTLKLGATTVYTDTVTVSGNGTYDTSAGTNPGGFTATTVGSYVWTASYADPLGNNNPASDPGTSAAEQVTLVGPPNVLITKTAEKKNADGSFSDLPNPATINLGDTAYFKITISNTGGSAASNVVLTDNLSRDPEGTGTGILTWTITQQTPTSPAATLGSQTGTSPTVLLTWNIGSLAASTTDTIIVGASTVPLLTLHSSDPGAPLPTNLFQLDGNAQVKVPTGAKGDDWDNVLGLDPTATQPGFVSSDFVTDGVNKTIFTTGGSKDTNDVNQWQWTDGTVPDKDDLLHAYSAVYEVPGKAAGVEDQILFFGADRFANNGDSNIGFWFFQQPVAPLAGGTFGPGVHTVGDVFIVSAFTQGGAVGTIQVYEWVGGSNPLKLISTGAPDPATGVFAVINTTPVPSPWPYTPKSGTAGTFPTGSFFEGGINLSTFGLAGCFTTFLGETRSSQTTSAQLKDFVEGNIATCKLVNTATVTWEFPVGTTHTSTTPPVEIDIAGTGAGSPLSSAGSNSATSHPQVAPLQDSQLQLFVQQAITRWQAAGLSSAALNELRNTPVHVADLGGAYLGMEYPNQILIDDDAAGQGWYLDPTPGNDSEFLLPGDQGEQGRVDLLTVVMHEMGHTLGLNDLYNPSSSQDIMYEYLSTGARRTPSPADVAQVLGAGVQAPAVGTTAASSPAHVARVLGARPQTLSAGTTATSTADQATLSGIAATLRAAPLAPTAFTTVATGSAIAANLPASVTTLPLSGTALMVRRPGANLTAALRDRPDDQEEDAANGPPLGDFNGDWGLPGATAFTTGEVVPGLVRTQDFGAGSAATRLDGQAILVPAADNDGSAGAWGGNGRLVETLFEQDWDVGAQGSALAPALVALAFAGWSCRSHDEATGELSRRARRPVMPA